MAVPMTPTLFNAILAMDSYNRGIDPRVANLLDDVGTRIGGAPIIDSTDGAC
jgi:hypothetical protein